MTMSSPRRRCSTYVIEFASAITGTAPSGSSRFKSSHGFARSASVVAIDCWNDEPPFVEKPVSVVR